MSRGGPREPQCARTQNIPVKFDSKLLGLWFGLHEDMAEKRTNAVMFH